jgi:hypothetical protein
MGLPWKNALIAEATKRVLECLPFTDVERITGRDQLGEKLRELSQLDQGRRRVVTKIALRQCADLHKIGIVVAQKTEICPRV